MRSFGKHSIFKQHLYVDFCCHSLWTLYFHRVFLKKWNLFPILVAVAAAHFHRDLFLFVVLPINCYEIEFYILKPRVVILG